MPANTAQLAALVPQPVPPDAECVSNLTQIVAGVAAYTQVLLSTAAAQGGDGSSVADQALNVANTALALAQSVQASIPQRRANSAPEPAAAGDSTVSITWNPPMPDENYTVMLSFFGPVTAGSTNWSWCVVNGSQTLNGCQLRLANVPANFNFTWVVQDLQV